MGNQHVLIDSFAGGQISPRLFGRSDQGIWDIAVASMVNFAPTVEGPAIKRSGSQLAGVAAAGATTILPFEYNATEAYALVFSQGLVTVYYDGAILTNGGTPVTIAVPYAAADAPGLMYWQDADVLYLCHPGYPPGSINRTGASTFTYTALALKAGPYQQSNSDRTITVYPSGTTVDASVTLTASSAIFQSGHVGGSIQLQAADFSAYVQWSPGIQVAAAQYVWWEGNLYQQQNGNCTGATPPTHTLGSEWDGSDGPPPSSSTNEGVLWLFVCNQFGQFTITGTTGTPTSPSTTCTATVTQAAPPCMSTSSYATWRWSLPMFCTANVWPKGCLIWNGRLIFYTDFWIIGSVVNDFLNFNTFDPTGLVQADLSYSFRIDGSDAIQWAAVDLQLVFSTTRAEYIVTGQNSSAAVDSTNIQVVRQSNYGSVPVRPVQAEERVIFIQRGGRKVREGLYSVIYGRYQSQNDTVWCRDLVQPGIKRLAWQQETEELIWALRNDGIALVHAFNPDQQVKGWSQVPIADFGGANANVIDMCSTPNVSGTTDVMWFLVERAGGVITVEYLNDWWVEGTPIAQGRFLDGALSYSGAPATHFGTGGSGFPSNYYGQTISVLADGVVTSAVVAGDGSFTLGTAASQVTAGILYTAQIVGLPPKLVNRAGGQSELVKKRLIKGIMRVINSAGLFLSSLLTAKPTEMLPRPQSTPMDSAQPLYDGPTNDLFVADSTNRNGQWVITSQLPLPAIVSQMRLEYTTEEQT
ncbi:hypothetical protein [Novosphingobium sp. FSW06-99]|uniref:hypothetical protein n=1 Tax=Novosphingobium sp. FSW06-99 TaxID=1739113 RepID=UPI00076DCC8E|nr:hypothetical protein [Novosphingobium sp. FSW06-99]KUR80909.1 hypothetical protein AQZ49_02480 [Novosphingobium sp. FSW06-99]